MPYAVASFSRAKRRQALLNHYQFLQSTAKISFFEALPNQPVLWEQQSDDDKFSITLSYPPLASFECELSLNFLVNGTLVQVLGFVIVPGYLVGITSSQALLFSQVQGQRDPTLLRHATRTLHDISPAALLVNTAFGLAGALGIGQAVGISRAKQVCVSKTNHFDYDIFWEQFQGEWLASGFYQFDTDAPEKPIEEIKAKYRTRTLRKRQYKQQVRQLVAANFRAAFINTISVGAVAD